MWFTHEIERTFSAPVSVGEEMARLDHVYSLFEGLGIATLASSRLAAYRRIFAKVSEPLTSSDVQAASAIFATLIEVRQLHAIARAARLEGDHWLPQLSRLVGGVAGRSERSRAMDFQFEMYVGAVASLAGCATSFEEPDLVIRFDDKTLGIAAKRPSTERKLEKRIRSAVHQVEKSGLPGLVAVDISQAFYPRSCVNAGTEAGAIAVITKAADRVALRWYERLASVLRRPDVLGLLVHLELPALVIEGKCARLISASRWSVVCAGGERASWATEFAARCKPGVA